MDAPILFQRIYLSIAALLLALPVVSLILGRSLGSLTATVLVTAAGLLILALSAWMSRLRGRGLAMLYLGFIALVGLAAQAGWGARAPGLFLLPFPLLVVAVFIPLRHTLLLGAATAAILVSVALWGPYRGDEPDLPPLVNHLVLQLASTAMAVAMGTIIGRELRAAMAAAIAREEFRYRDLFSAIPSAVILHRQGRIVDVNDAAVQLLGAAGPGGLIGRQMTDFHDASSTRAMERDLSQLNFKPAGWKLPITEYLLRDQLGRAIPVAGTSTRFETTDGPAVLSFFTEEAQRRAERAELDEQRALLRAVIDAAPDPLVLTDLDSGHIALCNHAYADFCGQPASVLQGREPVDLGVWVDMAERDALLADVLLHGQVVQRLVRIRHARQGTRLVGISASCIDLDGRPHLLMNGRDMTDEIARNSQLAFVLDGAAVGIVVIRHGRLVSANRHYEQLIRCKPGQGIERTQAMDFGSEEAALAVHRKHNAALRQGLTVEYEHPVHRADGTVFVGRFVGRLLNPGARDGFAMVWMIEDVTGQHEQRRLLEKTREDALSASRSKTDFMATLSHEIRTPLNGILGLLQLAREPQLDISLRMRYLDLLDDSAQALRQIVSGVLDLSKIEAGQMDIRRQAFDVCRLLHNLHRTYQSLADARGLLLELDEDPALDCLVEGDEVRVRQIITNYLSNALKFTLRGSITLAVRRLSHARVRVEVRDSGMGIEPAVLPRLFQPYQQSVSVAELRAAGTGLGLSICRQLAELMGGTVGVSSEHGQGSSFWVELPLSPAELPQLQLPKAKQPPPMLGWRILLAEDNPVNMLVITTQLERAGATVTCATDGQQAVDAFGAACEGTAAFDVVLLDVHMPVLDGLAAARTLRAHPMGRQACLVALTAGFTDAERELALQAGFDRVVPKPVDLLQLRDAIGSLHTRAGVPSEG